MGQHTDSRGGAKSSVSRDSDKPSGAVFFDAHGKVIGSAEAATATALGKRPQRPNNPHAEEGAPSRSATAEVPLDGTPEEIADGLGDMIHERFMSKLQEKLAANDGYLSDDDVEEMSQDLRSQLSDVRDIFLAAVDSSARANLPRQEKIDRKQTFRRLMVSKFEGRFAPEAAVARDPEKLTRRMLPGFFSALSMLLGPENVAKYQKRSTVVAETMQKQLGDDFTWERVYKSSEARKICLRALIDMSWHFQDVEKRVTWLVALVNSNMIPSPGGLAEHWELTEEIAYDLLRDMFADMVTTLSNKAAHDALARELGKERIAALKSFLHALY